MKIRGMWFAFLMLFILGCEESPTGPNPEDQPKPALAIHAEPMSLTSEGVLTATLSWLAQDPYTMHSVYYGAGEVGKPSGKWAVDPIVVDSIMRKLDAIGTSRTIEILIEVPLYSEDVPGYLCVVSWNFGLFLQTCTTVTWPALPGKVSDINLIFGVQPPPWLSLTVVPSEIHLVLDSSGVSTVEPIIAYMTSQIDGKTFMCVTMNDSGLRGWLQVDVLGDSVEEVYVTPNYEWYVDFGCRITFTSLNENVATVISDGVVELHMRPEPSLSVNVIALNLKIVTIH